MPMLPPAERQALLVFHRNHTRRQRLACQVCQHGRRVWPLALTYTLDTPDPRHPDDR